MLMRSFVAEYNTILATYKPKGTLKKAEDKQDKIELATEIAERMTQYEPVPADSLYEKSSCSFKS